MEIKKNSICWSRNIIKAKNNKAVDKRQLICYNRFIGNNLMGDGWMFTTEQLTKYANKFLNDNYGLELEVPLKLNGRLSVTCGRFRYLHYQDGRKEAKMIELNKYFAENNEPNLVLDVLRHELVHYALFMLNKPNKDGHPFFENELRKLGIISQNTIDNYNIQLKPVNVSEYRCKEENCGRIYTTRRALRNDGKNHRCKCGGKLESLGKKAVSAS